MLEKRRSVMRRGEEGERAEGRRTVRELGDSLASVVVTDSISQWMENHSGDVGLETSPHSAREGESKGRGSVFQTPSA